MKKGLLYGNGLSLALLSFIKSEVDVPYIEYLDSTKFLEDLINAKDHQRIYRKFIHYFQIDQQTVLVHEQAKIFIKKYINEIRQIGFERWFGKYHFVENDSMRLIKPYLYFIYNYWYCTIFEDILSNGKVQNIIKRISELLYCEDITYYTTNFDTLLDSKLQPKHLHGRFLETLRKYQDIIAFHLNDKEFEYIYLFGANGYEKQYRLKTIYETNCKYYDLDFFYNDQLSFDHLTIFGIAFGNAELFSAEFHKEYPNHDDEVIFNSVDGHILNRLEELCKTKKLSKLTLCYHTDFDLKYYKNIIKYTSLEPILEYIPSNEVINLNTAF